MTIGGLLAPVGMFWLSRVSEHSHYLTGVGLPLIVFAAAAGLIFVPLTMTLVAGIADEHSGVASSMFNARQQAGGAAARAPGAKLAKRPQPSGGRCLPGCTCQYSHRSCATNAEGGSM